MKKTHDIIAKSGDVFVIQDNDTQRIVGAIKMVETGFVLHGSMSFNGRSVTAAYSQRNSSSAEFRRAMLATSLIRQIGEENSIPELVECPPQQGMDIVIGGYTIQKV